MSLRLVVAAQSAIVTLLSRRDDRGQATAEYALVILGAAAMALLVIAWATNTSKVSTLLDRVVDSVTSRVA
jgi:hypothetical protein